jgi:hypothetical protein
MSLSRVAIGSTALLLAVGACGRSAFRNETAEAGSGGAGGEISEGGGGTSPSCSSSPWAHGYGDADDQEPRSLALSGSCDLVLAGVFRGSMTLGGATLQSAGASDMFVGKLGPDGSHKWSKRFGNLGAAESLGAWASADPDGNVLVGLTSEGAVDLGGGTLPSHGGTDIAVGKLAPDGSHLWSHSYGDFDLQYLTHVAADPAGNVILAGYFTGTLDFGHALVSSTGHYDVFVAKLDRDGQSLWAWNLGDGANATIAAVAVDDTGNVFAAGSYQGSADFGSGAEPATGLDPFVVALSTTGQRLAGHAFHGSASAPPAGLGFGDSGEVWLGGSFAGNLDVGGNLLVSTGGYDLYLARLDASLNAIWSQSLGLAGDERATSLAVDPSGNVWLTGGFTGTTDFGGGDLSSAGGTDGYVLELDPTGSYLSASRFGDAAEQRGVGIVFDHADRAVITAGFQGMVDLGYSSVTSQGGFDVLLAKLAQ